MQENQGSIDKSTIYDRNKMSTIDKGQYVTYNRLNKTAGKGV